MGWDQQRLPQGNEEMSNTDRKGLDVGCGSVILGKGNSVCKGPMVKRRKNASVFFLEQGSVNRLFLQRARYEYFSLSSHMVLVVTTQLCCCSAKAGIDM